MSLLSESHNRRRAGCQCPCSCGNENKQEGEKGVDKELEKIESLEGFVNMEKMLENRENFDKLVNVIVFSIFLQCDLSIFVPRNLDKC